MADINYTFRQIAKTLTQDDSEGVVTGRARRVDRVSKRAYCTTKGSKAGAWFSIQTQELADRLAARIAAGEAPSVHIRDDIVIDDTSTSSGGGRGTGSGVIVPTPGNQPGATLQAPQWREVDPLVAGVRSIAVAWIPIINAHVIGYRVKLVAPDGVVSFYSFSADEYEVEIDDITHGNYGVQVQGITAGGIAGDFNAMLYADVLADVTPPDEPKDIVHSWLKPDRTLDLFFNWSAPDVLPEDFAGYDVEIRNASTGYTKRRMTISGNATEAHYRFTDNQADVGGASPLLVIAIRSRDVWGNASAWVEVVATFPIVASPKTPARLTTIFKQVSVDLDKTPAFVEQQEIFISPGDQTIRLSAGTSNTNFFGVTGTTYTVSYRYIDAFGRATAYSPPSSIMVARNEIGFDDLGALEQVTVKSSKTRTAAELGALIDNKLLDQAFTTQAGEVISFEYPIATRIAGIVLYGPSAVSPTFYLSYDKLDGGVLELGGNVDADTTNGTLNHMIMREFPSGTNGRPISATLGATGGYFMAEWRFGDATTDPTTRKFKAIATRKLRVIFNNAVAISEVRILTYEAANTFVGRRMFLNEGLQIENDASSTGFQITSAGIKGYNNGVEQVSISSVDGKLRAAAGRITLDATGISIVPDTDFQTQRTYSFRGSDGTMIGEVGNRYFGPNSGFGTYGTNQTRLKGYPKSQTNTAVELVAEAIEGRAADVFLDSHNGVSSAYVDVLAVGSTAKVTIGPDLQVDRHASIYGDLYKRGNNGAVYGAGVVVPLFATSSSWNNRDAGVGWYTHSVTEWGVPSNAKGVFIRVGGRGDAQSDNNFIAISHNTTNYPLVCRQSVPTTSYLDQHGFCPIVDGNIYIRVNGVTFRSIYVIVTGFVL
jgi:hypothetical protein